MGRRHGFPWGNYREQDAVMRGWEGPPEEPNKRHQYPPCAVQTSKRSGYAYISDDEEDADESSTTPTSRDARIPEPLPCPPAPRKSRATQAACGGSGHKEFFPCPPDLEAVFTPRKLQSASK